MSKATIKLTEEPEKINGNTVVRNMKVEIEMTLKGDTLLTSAHKPGSIEFYSRENATAAIQKIATLKTYDCWAEDSTTKPVRKIAKFDINTAYMEDTIDKADSDFFVSLTFGALSFPNAAKMTLQLPWKPPAFTISPQANAGNYQIGARFLVDGNEESAAYLDIGTIMTVHANIENESSVVPDKQTAKKFKAVGVGNVHPLSLSVENADFPPPSSRKIPIGGNAFNILLDPSVATRCNTISPGSFDLAKLTSNLQTIFSPVFTSVTLHNIPAGDTRLTNWKLANSELYSSSIADTADPKVNEGHLVPFFDFWIYAAKSAGSGAFAQAETLAAPAHWYDSATKQKRIQKPVIIFTGSGSEFNTRYPALTSTDQKMILLAIVIGHEIGHNLGLVHCRKVEPGYPASDNTVAVMSYPNTLNGNYVLSKLGEVTTALLKHHYK